MLGAMPTTVRYATIPGVPANLTSLDVHPQTRTCAAPVVIWVHGGGYRFGDKRNQIAAKARLFNDRGWILVSTNYRLTVPGDPSSAHYPDHYDDVAAAVAWVHDHIADYGGDPNRIALLGHSAGADIVANVASNPAYLHAVGLGLGALRCAGPLDSEGFDKVTSDAEAGSDSAQWKVALGNEPDYQRVTSAVTWVRRGVGIPSTIVVVRGQPTRVRIEQGYLDQLAGAGVTTAKIDASSLSHMEVSTRIGSPGDKVMTPPLLAFLTRCFS